MFYTLTRLTVHLFSRLPLVFLYGLSTFAYFWVNHIFGYRKKIVIQNLSLAFPEKSSKEIAEMSNNFYAYFCDQMAETLKSFSITEAEIKKRVKIKNPEILDKLFVEKRDFVHVVSHHCNWEWYAFAFSLLSKHKLLFVYKPIDNKVFDKLIRQMREKFGAVTVPMLQTYLAVEQYTATPHASFMGGDQSPRTTRNVYWTQFFKQETAVFWGIEQIATQFNQPLILAKMNRVKRGFYEVELELLHDNPTKTQKGELTELHTRKLEMHLYSQPETWLWSHRRWKLKRNN